MGKCRGICLGICRGKCPAYAGYVPFLAKQSDVFVAVYVLDSQSDVFVAGVCFAYVIFLRALSM